jgi:hypothetical protein
MTISVGARAIPDAALVSSTGLNEAGPSKLNNVQVSKADGLRGALGFYEVTIDGRSQFMTKDELESLERVTSAQDTPAALSSSVIKKGNDTVNGTIVKGFG